MKLELYQYVALYRDFPEYNLKQGDVAMLIDYMTHPSSGEDGCVLEVFNAVGDSIAVFTVPMSAVEKMPSDAVLAIHPLAELK
ncbi:DUF4926 domain-containing protein [Nostoc sp.]|uniref:DUF4926 domain-containing protein n=1 Tax=Nostoc sp. TaxID=1180 RepID=UPI002FF76F20